MAEDRIDSVIDRQAIEEEIGFLGAKLDEMLAKIKEFAGLKIKFDGAKDLGGLADVQKKATKGQNELSLATREYQKLQDQIATKQARLNALNSESAQQLENLKQKERERNKELRDAAKLQDAAADSTAAMAVELEKLQRQFDLLSRADKQSEFGQKLLADIQKLDAAVKADEFNSGRFRRNVGNYQGSAEIIVRALERARQKFNDLNRDARASPEAVSQAGREMQALQRIVDQPQFLNVAAKFGDATAEVKFFTKQLIDLERQGLGNGSVANELRAQLAQLTDQIGDTREEIKALSSDTRGFDLFAGAVSSLTSAAQTAAGVQELLGSSNDDVAKSVQRLVAIQNVANGVQAIAEQITKRGTAANKAYAFITAQIEILQNRAATSTSKLNAALKLGLIGAVAVGLYEVAKAVGLFGDQSEVAKKKTEELNKELERQSEIIASIGDAYDKTGAIRRERLKQQGADDQKLFEDELSDKKQQLEELKAVEQKARNDEIKFEQEFQKKLEEVKRAFGAENVRMSKKDAEELAKQRGINVKRVAEASKAVQDQELAVTLFTEQRKTKIYEDGVEAKKKAGEKAAEAYRKGLEDEEKADLELFKFRTELAADEQRRIGELEVLGLERRKQALFTEAELRKSIVRAQQDFDLTNVARQKAELIRNGEFTAEQERAIQLQVKLINEKGASEKEKIDRELATKILQIKRELNDKLRQEEFQSVQDFVDAQNQKLVKIRETTQRELAERLLLLQNNDNEERAQAIKNFQDGITTREQLQGRLSQIDAQGRRAALSNTLIFLQNELALLKEAGDDTLALEQQIADLKKQIQDESSQALLAAVDKEIELRQQKFEGFLNLVKGGADLVQSLIGSGIDSQKNAIQDEIELIEERKRKEIEAINASADSAEKKQARIKLAEANAQKDRERLELRQAELDRRKAVFQKAFQALQITIGGIEAVARIKATVAKLTAEAVANPLLLPLIPVAAAQIPITLALTAAQLVALAATPIPKFAHGVEDAQPGLGIWGEAGQEMMVDREGRLRLSPKGPSLVRLMGGETILPHQATKNLLNSIGMEGAMGAPGGGFLQIDQAELVELTGAAVHELKKLNGRPVMHQYIGREIESTEWFDKNIRN